MKRIYRKKPSPLEEREMIKIRKKRARGILVGLVSVLLAAILTGSLFRVAWAEGAQRTFSSPEEAVNDFIGAVEKSDKAGMMAILGPEGKDIITTRDEVADKQARGRFLASYREKHMLDMAAGRAMATLSVGNDNWPFPIPIVKKGDGWVFDTLAGREELINRRIGRNELDAMKLCQIYLKAQREYARSDWDNDGVLQYAQKFRSDKGKWNGLYWEAAEDEIKSPLGPLYARAAEEGYVTGKKNSNQATPFHGYLFRILKAQGKNAPGGAYNYVINGRMVAGFAMVAFPAEYRSSGVMTFLVNQNGTIYQKDLGPGTTTMASQMKLFNPNGTWIVVERVLPE